ncbi:MAG TPA: maleylpyruvate isomerase family mycothiol-dependent enzyme [Actinomycetota bacterium]
MDRKRLLGIAHAERERLGRTIQYAPPESWEVESACAGWRNRDVLAHLVGHEYAAAQVVGGEEADEFASFREANGGEFWVNGFNEWAVGVRRDLPARQVITDWGRAADLLLGRLAQIPEGEWDHHRVAWVAGDIGVKYLVQSRIIEWWLHGEDVRQGAGLEENPQHWPVYLVNDMGIRMLPYALGISGLSLPGKSLQVDLEGVGEGSWHWGLGPRETPAEDKKPDAFVQGRGPAFALVAGRRAKAEHFLDDGNLVIGGDEDVALAVLEHIGAYVE